MLEIFEKAGITCIRHDIFVNGIVANRVHQFYVDGMLIDAGASRNTAEMKAIYEKMDIDFVVLTHHHEDHSGTAPWIEKNMKIPVYIHENGLKYCALDTPYPEHRRLFWGNREVFHPSILKEDFSSRTRNWRAIYTPGHADDHVALYDEANGIMFTGDLYLAPKIRVMMRGESLPQLIDSFHTVLSYDFSTMFCSHAGYVENGKEMLQMKLTQLETINENIINLHRQGLDAEEINLKLFPKVHPMTISSKGEMDSLHIVTSVVKELSIDH